MKLSEELIKQLQADIEKSKSTDDLMGKDGAIKKLVKGLLEEMLAGELSGHLGYDKHDKAAKTTTNRRNGKSRKTLKSEYGPLPINIPRDREGEFDPVLIKKYQKDLGVIEDKVLSMYARGMSTRDIESHIREIYGIDIAPSTISKITEKIIIRVKVWHSRPLERLYPILYFDAIHFKVREEGKVITKAAYTALGVDLRGHKDLLGIWIGDSESATFWLSVLTEIRNRGVQDILITCVDGLKGFPEAIASVFPKAEIQVCIIHQIRNSLRYVNWNDRKPFMRDLKLVYQAATLEAADSGLEKLEEKWGKKYALVVKSWQRNWPNLSTYFKYPEEIRRIIYTTNIVEGLHRQLRKVTKTKSLFPNEDALRKLLFMAYENIAKKWNRPLPKWPFIISQLAIIFEDRLELDI